MHLLALDTSTEACSAALLLDGEMRLRFTLTERSHAELILPMIDSLLAEAAIALDDLDAIAFGRGPGGFTGLRIAAGVAQGLAYGAGLPVAPVSSLAATAELVGAGRGETILVCNDARMGECYWAVFERAADGSIAVLGPEHVGRPGAVAMGVTGLGHAAGNGLARFPELRDRLIAEGLQLHDGLYPRADAIARLGAIEIAAGRGVDAAQALPVYVRDDVARPAGSTVT
ncbi:MAG TPA: tRNA (adenosine(37)-N6)-threonylcarbamoyltransferase complex dimerization subunit type 1 TsaB [Steroidobacteraceae bacterium]|nr:tRNA (adenosine(37)-N6)-threonylcarbamoyltransferase complex dimerization subunit type 1 TsaB [Steroidobacteraceae bacterium]